MTTVSVKLPDEILRRIPARNRSNFIRAAILEKLEERTPEWKPASAFAKKLASLRARHEASGARLLSAEEVSVEVRSRRGSLA